MVSCRERKDFLVACGATRSKCRAACVVETWNLSYTKENSACSLHVVWCGSHTTEVRHQRRVRRKRTSVQVKFMTAGMFFEAGGTCSQPVSLAGLPGRKCRQCRQSFRRRTLLQLMSPLLANAETPNQGDMAAVPTSDTLARDLTQPASIMKTRTGW